MSLLNTLYELMGGGSILLINGVMSAALGGGVICFFWLFRGILTGSKRFFSLNLSPGLYASKAQVAAAEPYNSISIFRVVHIDGQAWWGREDTGTLQMLTPERAKDLIKIA